MKKISLFRKIIFHTVNSTLIILYVYPGSILGWLIYNNVRKQPKIKVITSDWIFFSLNHYYAFLILSIIGLICYYRINVKILFLYLFFISIILEMSHLKIPHRNFEYEDLFGNFLGVLTVFLIFILYKFFRKTHD